jgi:hypothetical protein
MVAVSSYRVSTEQAETRKEADERRKEADKRDAKNWAEHLAYWTNGRTGRLPVYDGVPTWLPK